MAEEKVVMEGCPLIMVLLKPGWKQTRFCAASSVLLSFSVVFKQESRRGAQTC